MRTTNLLSIVAAAAVLLTACVSEKDAMAEGIFLEVTGGKADVEDWVAEATLNLAPARKLLGWKGQPARIAVVEVDDDGQPGKQVQTQIDRVTPAVRQARGGQGSLQRNPQQAGQDLVTIAWRVPGKLAAGKTRRFLVRFDASRIDDADRPVVRVESDENRVTVTNGDIALEHEYGTGGFIHRATVAHATGKLVWLEKIVDRTAYYCARRDAKRMDIAARGPLRAMIEVENEYMDAAGNKPDSNPRSVYRFTNYAGLPFTVVEALVTQEFTHPWQSLHFIEMGTGDAGFTHCTTDGGTAELKQTGKFTSGSAWAAIYNDQLLVATCAGTTPGVYDGGGKHYLQYLRSGFGNMTTLTYRWKDMLFWGSGGGAIEAKTVSRWSKILTAPPTVRIIFTALEMRLTSVRSLLAAKERAQAGRSGKAWAVEHVALTGARGKSAEAGKKLAVGRFTESLGAIESCEKFLNVVGGQTELVQAGPVLAGLVLGYPYLGNDHVVYLWAKPTDGAGLISIFDRKTSRELLAGDPAGASVWEVTVKQGKDGEGASFTSKGRPCRLDSFADRGSGRLVFRWTEGIAVEVDARLRTDEALLRGRIKAIAPEGGPSLVTVTFPVVKGIQPLTRESRGDVILDAQRFGIEKPSPLASGRESSTGCPPGMQFTALTGDGMGLYFGEEDGQSNAKHLAWVADADNTSLAFSIAHPVLDWGGDEPVREYDSPGDIVLGPFHGDWYDAARIYRRWALTAPWCSKGPIYERADYPQWLLRAPYWSIGYMQDENDVEDELRKQAFFEIPTMVTHLYNYFFPRTLDDRNPEYFPPRFGSAGFKRSVERLQSKGIRVVPYVNGSIWDTDTDSYRMEEAEKRGACWSSPAGNAIITTSYGGGASLAYMCPGSPFWRKKMSDFTAEMVGRYGVDGIYFDFLTDHNSTGAFNCYNKEHGHPICGGNFWAKAVHDLYGESRAVAKQLNPEAMITGEGIGEYCIDVHDTFLSLGTTGSNAPLFQAVYHGYTNLYGGVYGRTEPVFLGRWWLMGCQNGWHGSEVPMSDGRFASMGRYYRDLLKCRWEFGTPYLGYGEMLRPPKIEGNIPTISPKNKHGPFTVPLVEGSAWKAPDGTVGLFFLNYDQKNPYDFAWTVDLAETGIDKSKKVRISRWTQGSGLSRLKDAEGGEFTETMRIEPLGMIALKLEVLE